MPPIGLKAYAAVSLYGKEAHGELNWALGTEWSEFANSTMRHIEDWLWEGDNDYESGLNTLWHALWNLVTLIYYQDKGIGTDDRWVTLLAEMQEELRAPVDTAAEFTRQAEEQGEKL